MAMYKISVHELLIDTKIEKFYNNARIRMVGVEVVFPLRTHTETNVVTFSYSVHWQESEIAWASRWDIYLRMSDVQIHWFAICNSVAIVLFLSGMSKHTSGAKSFSFVTTVWMSGSCECSVFPLLLQESWHSSLYAP